MIYADVAQNLGGMVNSEASVAFWVRVCLGKGEAEEGRGS